MAEASFFLTAPGGKEMDQLTSPNGRLSPQLPVKSLPAMQSGVRAHVRKGSTSKPVFVHERFFQIDEVDLKKFSVFGQNCLASSDEENSVTKSVDHLHRPLVIDVAHHLVGLVVHR